MANIIKNQSGISEKIAVIVLAIILVTAFILSFLKKEEPIEYDLEQQKREIMDNIINSPLFKEINEIAANKLQQLQQSQVNKSLSSEKGEKKTLVLHQIEDNAKIGELQIFEDNDSFLLKITADLTELITGYYYSVWLKLKDSDNFVNIGKMEKNDENKFYLDFSTSEKLEDYDALVISIDPKNFSSNLPSQIISEISLGK